MPLLDERGRLLGKLNLFDLFVSLLVVTLVALTYFKLSSPYRVAPPYASNTSSVTVVASLQLPAEQAWMCEVIQAGNAELDPRTGQPRAEVRGCTVIDGVPVIELTVFAVRDDAGRLLFEGAPLLPGRTLQLETETAILEGVVQRVDSGAP